MQYYYRKGRELVVVFNMSDDSIHEKLACVVYIDLDCSKRCRQLRNGEEEYFPSEDLGKRYGNISSTNMTSMR